MPRITDLPVEVVATILRHLDKAQFLPPSLLVCRCFYSAGAGIAAAMLRRQIPPALLPYAVAVLESSRMAQPPTAPPVQELLDRLYNEPARLAAKLKTMPLGDLIVMEHLHDLICTFTDDAMGHAWSLLSKDELELSQTEHIRVCRAFCRVELLLNLFRTELSDSLAGTEKEMFLNRHPPWESEQMGCIHDFLQKKFVDGRSIFYNIITEVIKFISLTHALTRLQLHVILFFKRLTV
jgi:hypothetical protein